MLSVLYHLVARVALVLLALGVGVGPSMQLLLGQLVNRQQVSAARVSSPWDTNSQWDTNSHTSKFWSQTALTESGLASSEGDVLRGGEPSQGGEPSEKQGDASEEQSDLSEEQSDTELDTDEGPDALPYEHLLLAWQVHCHNATASEGALLTPWRDPDSRIARPPRA